MRLWMKLRKNKVYRYFSWREFDESVEEIAKKAINLNPNGIFGVPRGGLCLAVALSHRLQLKLITEPQNKALIVDDIFDSGKTLNSLKSNFDAYFFVLFSKAKPKWLKTINIAKEEEWIVFPWENKNHAKEERDEFTRKREGFTPKLYLKNDYGYSE